MINIAIITVVVMVGVVIGAIVCDTMIKAITTATTTASTATTITTTTINVVIISGVESRGDISDTSDAINTIIVVDDGIIVVIIDVNAIVIPAGVAAGISLIIISFVVSIRFVSGIINVMRV